MDIYQDSLTKSIVRMMLKLRKTEAIKNQEIMEKVLEQNRRVCEIMGKQFLSLFHKVPTNILEKISMGNIGFKEVVRTYL